MSDVDDGDGIKERYQIRDSGIGEYSNTYRLRISRIDDSINICFYVRSHDSFVDDLEIEIPLFQFQDVRQRSWANTQELYVAIDNDIIVMTYNTMIPELRKDEFSMSDLLMINKYVFGIHWKEWIEKSGYNLYMDLT